jgi:hypothetical protein
MILLGKTDVDSTTNSPTREPFYNLMGWHSQRLPIAAERGNIMKLKLRGASCMLMATLLMPAHWAHAVLGQSAASIGSDAGTLKAVRRSAISHAGYTVEVITADATTVREYASPAGIVFAIAWNGYVHPDLTQLLGSYWSEYSTARQNHRRKTGSRHEQLKAERIVVERSGQMRNLRGRAYVPDLIPAGVNIDEIK